MGQFREAAKEEKRTTAVKNRRQLYFQKYPFLFSSGAHALRLDMKSACISTFTELTDKRKPTVKKETGSEASAVASQSKPARFNLCLRPRQIDVYLITGGN